MTDQDPTQRYDAAPPEPPVAPPPADAAAAAAASTSPLPPMPAAAPADASPTEPIAAVAPPAPPVDAPLAAAAAAAPPPPDAPMFAPVPPAAPEAVATSPVTIPPSTKPRRGILKWAVALVVVLLVVGAAGAAAALLTGSSATPEVASWTPADSVLYAEMRLDLPGNQQAEVAKVLSAFPGFDDQAAFPTKLHEALDQLVGKASDGKQSYTADIEPWFSGQLAVSMGSIPSGTPNPSDIRFLALASTKDAAKANAWATGVLQESGATGTTETHNGVTITKVSGTPADSSAMPGVEVAFATYGPVLAIGDLASVKASIDTAGKTGLPSNEQFKTAAASLPGDRLAFLYQDSAAIVDAGKAAADAPALGGMPQLPAFLTELYAPWSASVVRAENGAIVFESRQPHVDTLGPAKSAESTLPSLVPPGTLLLVDAHDTGEALQRFKTLLASDPSLADGVKQVDDALNIVGGFDAITGWMGEAGIAIAKTGDSIGGGLVIVPTDKAAADRLLTQLRGFITLAGDQAGIKISDEPYNGATITTLDLSGLAPMAGSMGADLPANLSISYAVTDEVVVLGYGTDFVKGVVDAQSGDSLADTDRFKSAIDRVDKVNGSLFWLDIAGARGLLEPLIPADAKAKYESDIKPYVEPIDYFIATSVPSDDLDAGKAVITVTGQ